MTLQSLVVIALPFLVGPACGFASVVAYLGLGLMGVPVFAGLGAGLPYVMGPTGGYLVGFLLAASLAQMAAHSSQRKFLPALAVFMVGHIVIVAAGFAWLVWGLGFMQLAQALMVAVMPFIVGSILKSFLGATIVYLWHTRT